MGRVCASFSADYAALAERVIENAERTVLREAQLQSNLERGIVEAEQQYLAIVEQTEQISQIQIAAAETSENPGVESVVQQYIEAVEMFGGETASESASTDVRTEVVKNTDTEHTTSHTPLETMDPAELDWDARELFSLDEDSTLSKTDTATQNSTDIDSDELYDFDPWGLFSSSENSEVGENADVFEKNSFLVYKVMGKEV